MYPKLHHAAAPYDLSRAWREEWRQAGFLVVGWGWLEGDPAVEAQVAVRRCRELDLDGYIANCEFAYEGWHWSDGGAWKSRKFVDEFRRLAPRPPLALSGLTAIDPWVRDFDYAPWKEAGAVFRPQSYDAHGSLPVDESVAYSLRCGWPLERVMPDLLTSGDHDTPADVAALAAAGTVGFGFFLGSNATDDDYRTAGAAIRNHGIAL